MTESRPPDDPLFDAAAAIARGEPVDWAQVPVGTDTDTTTVVAELQALEGLSLRSNPVPNAWGPFTVLGEIGHGSFGTVYRARQLAVERDVAIKVLHADIDPSSEDGKLFVHEIRSVGRIDHANVVRIFQADITHDGRLFFAMELLDGSDLQQLGADKLPKQRAVDLTRQLLAGLGAAHDAGLVHADIKPANAIVIPPRVVDQLDSAPRSTITGTWAKVSTLFISVGFPHRPYTPGNGGLFRGSPRCPSMHSSRADSSPRM